MQDRRLLSYLMSQDDIPADAQVFDPDVVMTGNTLYVPCYVNNFMDQKSLMENCRSGFPFYYNSSLTSNTGPSYPTYYKAFLPQITFLNKKSTDLVNIIFQDYYKVSDNTSFQTNYYTSYASNGFLHSSGFGMGTPTATSMFNQPYTLYYYNPFIGLGYKDNALFVTGVSNLGTDSENIPQGYIKIKFNYSFKTSMVLVSNNYLGTGFVQKTNNDTFSGWSTYSTYPLYVNTET